MNDKPAPFYFRPELRLLARALVCWLRGHRWQRTSLVADRWGNHNFDCARCFKRVAW